MGCRALLDTTTGDASIDRRAFPDAPRHRRGPNPPTADHTELAEFLTWRRWRHSATGRGTLRQCAACLSPLRHRLHHGSPHPRRAHIIIDISHLKAYLLAIRRLLGPSASGQRRADCGAGQTPASDRLQDWADSAKASHHTRSLRPAPPILNPERRWALSRACERLTVWQNRFLACHSWSCLPPCRPGPLRHWNQTPEA